MKFPEHCIFMEARLPSTVHKWLKQELELLGIDSLIYTRYIISLLLHQDIEDLDWYDNDDMFYRKSKVDKWRKKGKKQDLSEEEAKKTAVIDCLSAVSEEKTGIKVLVEELCTKLKEEETDSCHIQNTPTSSESSEDSGTENQNPVERYYAAFPSLTSQEQVPNTSQSPSINLWKKNPLTKAKSLPSSSTPGYDSGNSEDAEVSKINVSCKIAVPKHRKQKKNPSRNNNRGNQEKRKSAQKPAPPKPSHVRRKSLHDGQPNSMQSWPPGFAKTDPYVLQNIDMYGNKLVLRSDIKQPQDEICTQVEQILKGYLLPAPEKAYKELQDVDNTYLEQRERVKKAVVKDVNSDPAVELFNEKTALNQADQAVDDKADDPKIEQFVMRKGFEERVSPELREQEIWYTQPINVIFQDDEEESQDSKLRLYKRNSLSSSSPGIASGGSDVQNPDCFLSSDSSPVCIQRNGRSSDDSDYILQDSDLIPGWLTEELLADLDGDSGYIRDEEFCFKASSPNPLAGESGLDVFKNLELMLDNSDNLCDSLQSNRSGSNTPTCNMTTVSLVDIGYLSNFGQDPDNFFYDNFTAPSVSRRYSFSSWQSCVLLDNPISPDLFQQPESMFVESQWWQPLDIGGYFMAQLWDVNMQRRSKISSWETNTTVQENQIWWSENMLIFHDTVSEYHREVTEGSLSECRNTLIPQISIDVCDYNQSEYDDVSDDLTDDDGTNVIFPPQFDRSLSLGDMYGWVNRTHRYDEAQLSKSFDLVPSEHSAFYDVPRKLVHVHSEPNLVQFRQDFLDGHQHQAASPQEHLFFSPKTHFRPITPAYAPELSSTSSSKAQYVLNDLFGGLPATKTPYQRFHVNEGESEEESFVPKFKLKNFSKSIQTGEGFDTAGSSDDEDVVESEMRDTPETLTLGMIEDVMGEKDEDLDPLGPISEDFDTANTDSAYETDYGVSSNECGPDGHIEGCKNRCPHQHVKQERLFTCEINRLADIGNVIDYDIQSFQATYPHTQDWPDLSQSLHCPQDSGQYWNTDWHSHSYHGYPISNTWSVNDSLAGGETDANEDGLNSENKGIGKSLHNLDPWLPDQYAGSYIEHCLTSGQWVEDIGGNVFLDENYDTIYPVTWSSFDKEDVLSDVNPDFTDKPLQSKTDAAIVDDMFSMDLASSGPAILDVDKQNGDCGSSSYQRLKVFSSQFFGTDDGASEGQCYCDVSAAEGVGYRDGNVTKGKDYCKISNSDTGSEESDSGIQLETEKLNVNNSNEDINVIDKGEGEDDGVIHLADKIVKQGDNRQSDGDGNVHRVKLVYKDNFEDSSKADKKKMEMLKGSMFMALPDDVRLSSELEKEWFDLNMKNTCEGLIPSSFQRKPCSFFLEGNCRRTDCKFAHDIANITCRFWEEGGCFKGPLCPFLHGYPSISSSTEKSSKMFELQSEEFPELSLTIGNSCHSKKEKIPASTSNKDTNKDRMIRPPNRQTSGTSVKREKHRKQNNRRHSNKENRVEICIIDKCSSSI